jgi:hypothetical protein
MYELIERTSCAGCDVEVNDTRLTDLFKQYNGSVGWTSDKSVQLLFNTKWELASYQRAATQIGVIFD